MKRYSCPKCNQESFSYWQKQMLGPLRSIECENCGVKVTVPWGMSLLVLAFGQIFPIIDVIAALMMVPKNWPIGGVLAVVFVACVIGAIPLFYAWGRYVPLVEKSS